MSAMLRGQIYSKIPLGMIKKEYLYNDHSL